MITADPYYPVYRVGRLPEPILRAARRRRLAVAEKYDMPFVFDKNLLSVTNDVRVPEETHLLGPAHPLFEAVCQWSIGQAREAFTRGATLVDPNLSKPQRLWLVRSVIQDERGKGRQRRAHEELAVVIADDLGLRATSPAYLLNCTGLDVPIERPAVPEKTNETIQMWAYEQITEPQLRRVRREREAECDLRSHYLQTTFKDLIMELQGQLNDLYQAQLYGDDDPEERCRLEKRISELKERKTKRLEELEQMRRLHAELPLMVTSALIVPAPVAVVEDEEPVRQGVPMRRDDEVEQIAMEITLRYERSRGWTPFDVHTDGEHYDIRSESPTGAKRFIEVKGRAQSGPVMLTGPEINRLRQLGERAYLYIVTFCKSEKPRLRIIQNPMASLTPEALYRQVQYLVQESDWAEIGEEIKLHRGGSR